MMTFDKAEDKRRFHRIFYQADATLAGNEHIHPCKILDLSLKGCLLFFEEAWNEDPERLYTLTLKLTDSIDIKMDVVVVHVIGNEAGFKCEHIDLDSISQLRRLIELNLGDSELLERDMLALSDVGDH